MKAIEIPTCRQQKEFEDMSKTLIKVMAGLHEAQQIEVFERALELASENRKREYNIK